MIQECSWGSILVTMLVCVYFLMLVTGVSLLVYRLAPKELMGRHAAYCLPLAVGAIQLVFALPVLLSPVDWPAGPYSFIYLILLNTPISGIADSPSGKHILDLAHEAGLSFGVVFTLVSTVAWMSVSSVVGLLIDRRRQRAKPRKESG